MILQGGLVMPITAVQLIPAIPAQRNRDMPARQAADQERGQNRRISNRLVNKRGQVLQKIQRRLLNGQHMMLSAKGIRYQLRMSGFVKRRTRVANREGLNWLA